MKTEDVNLKLGVGNICCICSEMIREGEDIIYRFSRILDDGTKVPTFAHVLCYEYDFCMRAIGAFCGICDEKIHEGENFSFIDRHERGEYADTPIFAHFKCIEDAAIYCEWTFVPRGYENKWLKYLPSNFNVKEKMHAYYSSYERRRPGCCYLCDSREGYSGQTSLTETLDGRKVHSICKELELERREKVKDKAKYRKEFKKKKCAKCSEEKKLKCLNDKWIKIKCFRDYIVWKKKQTPPPTLDDYA